MKLCHRDCCQIGRKIIEVPADWCPHQRCWWVVILGPPFQASVWSLRGSRIYYDHLGRVDHRKGKGILLALTSSGYRWTFVCLVLQVQTGAHMSIVYSKLVRNWAIRWHIATITVLLCRALEHCCLKKTSTFPWQASWIPQKWKCSN